MGRAKVLRNLAFVGLLVTAVAATETRLLAFTWSDVDQLCIYYGAEYDCGCSSNHFGTLSWTGSCDFSQEKVREDMTEARALAITGTPTFLFGTIERDGNLKVIHRESGALPIEVLVKILDQVLVSAGPDAHENP